MAILQLTTAPDDRVIPICLPSNWTDDMVLNDNILTMASFRGGYHKKSIPVMDGEAKYCHDYYKPSKKRKINEIFSLNYLCSEHMTMKGDSGSPLMRKINEDIWTLIAIVRGSRYSEDVYTEKGTLLRYGIYHTIFPRLSWVLETVKKQLP